MHPRRSVRLKDYDYTQDGVYSITICTQQRQHLFGNVLDGVMALNALGCVADTCWQDIPNHFPGIELDAWVVMPNHLHGVILITRWENTVGARHGVPLQIQSEQFGKPLPGSLATIVRSYKSAVTRQINCIRQTPGASVWQRNYYEHIIRNEREWNATCAYIRHNPARWSEDDYYG